MPNEGQVLSVTSLSELDVYQVAYLCGGPQRVALAAVIAMARGIQVDDVDLVVQFGPPNDHEDYLHGSGRTA